MASQASYLACLTHWILANLFPHFIVSCSTLTQATACSSPPCTVIPLECALKGCISSSLNHDSPRHLGVSCPRVPSCRSGLTGPQGKRRSRSWCATQGHCSSSEHLSFFLHSACTVPRGVCTKRLLDFSSDLCRQEVLHIGSAHNRSAMPFTASPASSSAPRVITNQYNNPAGLYSSENISNFNNALESKTAASGQETNGRA